MMAVRTWGIMAAASVVMMVATAVVGSILEARGSASPSVKIAVIVSGVSAFVVLAAAIPPLALRAFLAGQVAIGNGEYPLVTLLVRHEASIVRAFWVLMAAGMAIALPVILRELGFKV
jgi:hypothetical protein